MTNFFENNKEVEAILKEVQENIVDEMNFFDHSVGIEAVSEITEEFIQELKDNNITVLNYTSTLRPKLRIVVGQYVILIGLEDHNFGTEEYESNWAILSVDDLNEWRINQLNKAEELLREAWGIAYDIRDSERSSNLNQLRFTINEAECHVIDARKQLKEGLKCSVAK